MLLIQTNGGVYIRLGATFFTCLKEFKGAGTIMHKSQHFRTITIPPRQHAQLKRDFKNFCLTLFNGWRCARGTTTTWHKNNIQDNRFYAWPEFWFGGF